MKLISQRQRITDVEYFLEFDVNDCPGAGFGFDCDERGNVDFSALSPAALANLDLCLCGSDNISYAGIRKHVHIYIQPAIGLCSCGDQVSLDGFTNTCDNCGADYNQSGQRLAPRSHWGEETGEHWSDIVRY